MSGAAEASSTPEVEAEEEEHATKGPVKKPVSAFLHYCAEQRPHVKLVMPNASAGDITKAISESWRQLSEEAKKKFMDLATADKQRYEAERASAPKTQKAVEAHETVIPIARVKKIAKLDPEVKSVSKEATAVIAKMTELFVGRLANETRLASSGKKIIKASDVAHCIHHRPAFAWLRADYPLSEYAQTKASQPRAKLVRPENNATIGQFFAPAPKKQALGPADDDDDDVPTSPDGQPGQTREAPPAAIAPPQPLAEDDDMDDDEDDD